MISYENINAELISEGTYGITYKIKKENDLYCIKQYKQNNNAHTTKGLADDMIRDIIHNIMSYSKISLFGINYKKKYIVMTYYPQTISSYIRDNKFIQTKEWLNDLKIQILTQLYILHSHGFVHSDIKLENILYQKMPTGENKFTLCDFGLTEYYGYPRIIKDHQCTEYFKIKNDTATSNDHTNNTVNSDIYSIGACIYYLTSGLMNGYSNHITYDILKANKYVIEQFIQIKELCKFILPELNHNTKSILGIKSYLKPIERKNTHAIIAKVGQLFPFHISATNASNFSLSYKLFNKLYIKSNVANYTFKEIYDKYNEINYLDDMYSIYRNHKLSKPNGLSSNKYHIKYNIIELYFDTKASIETIFFAFHLSDMLDVANLTKSSSTIIFNLTFKILEYQSFHQRNITENTIIDLETILIHNLYTKQSKFIPVGFLVYYYITKIAKTYPLTYYSLLGQLESISLSMAILFFIDYTSVYQTMTELTYADICYHIVDISLDFILNGTFINYTNTELPYSQDIINQCRSNACRMTNDTILFKIIENIDLYSYLTNSVGM
jgi:serine/threonine protein kinase